MRNVQFLVGYLDPGSPASTISLLLDKVTSIQSIAPLKILMGKVKGMDHYYIKHAITVKTRIFSKHLLRVLPLHALLWILGQMPFLGNDMAI